MQGQESVNDSSVVEKSVVELAIADLGGAVAVRLTGENLDHARALAESDAELPPILVHRSTLRIIDGVHRVRAARMRGEHTIAALLFDGTDREAFVHAVRLNVTHGLPLSLAERKAAAARVLREYPEWSDRSIAAVAGLSDKTIGAIRRSNAEIPQAAERVARDGTVSRRSIAAGRLRAAELLRDRPDVSLREIAEEAEISLTTAKDVRSRLRRGDDPLPARDRTSGRAPVEPATADSEPSAPELAMQRLRRDPAVRLTEGGRWLLRLMDATALDEQSFMQAMGSLPLYHLETMAQLARQRGAVWTRMVSRIEERARSNHSANIS
jgi:ParB-like chromosome segregation protein Spo0J